jgi:hypothetical protein
VGGKVFVSPSPKVFHLQPQLKQSNKPSLITQKNVYHHHLNQQKSLYVHHFGREILIIPKESQLMFKKKKNPS